MAIRNGILPESSAERVEQQNSSQSARTKQIQHCEGPNKPLKNHGCESSPGLRPASIMAEVIASAVLFSAVIMAEVIVGA
jgi:hypothetical protein